MLIKLSLFMTNPVKAYELYQKEVDELNKKIEELKQSANRKDKALRKHGLTWKELDQWLNKFNNLKNQVKGLRGNIKGMSKNSCEE